MWTMRASCSSVLSPPPPAAADLFSMSLMAHSHSVGGRIRHFLPLWQSITSDKWILHIVWWGYALLFLETLPPFPPYIQRLLEDHLSLLQQKEQAVLAKGAMERVPMAEVGHGCYSHYFKVPKKDGGLHPILDLCPLNAE